MTSSGVASSPPKRHLPQLALVVLLVLLNAVTTSSTSSSYVCPKGCDCNDASITCTSVTGLRSIDKSLPIKRLVLSGLELKKIPAQLENIRNITELDLSNNHLSEVSHLGRRIRRLNLSQNRITSGKLSKVPQFVESLNLSHNDITYLPLNLMKLKKLRYIELADNPINCTCETLHIRNWLTTRHVWSDQHIKCSAPQEFKGRPWLQVKQSDVCHEARGRDGGYNWDDYEDENDLMLGDQADLEAEEEEDEDDFKKEYFPVGEKVKSQDPPIDIQNDEELEDGSGDGLSSDIGEEEKAEARKAVDLSMTEGSGENNNETAQYVRVSQMQNGGEEDEDDDGSGSGGGLLIPGLRGIGIDETSESPKTDDGFDDDATSEETPITAPDGGLGIFGKGLEDDTTVSHDTESRSGCNRSRLFPGLPSLFRVGGPSLRHSSWTVWSPRIYARTEINTRNSRCFSIFPNSAIRWTRLDSLPVRNVSNSSSNSSTAATSSEPSLTPVEESQKSPKVKLKSTDVKRLLEFAKPERWNIAGGVSCLVLSSAITMSVPFGLGKILDAIYATSSETGIAKEKLDQFCMLLAGIFLLGGLANFGRVYLFSNASLRITRDIRAKVYSSMLNQEAGWFDQKGTGELVNRLSSDTYQVGNSLSMNLSDGLRSTAMIMAGTGMMVYTSPHLALVGMCIVPCMAGMAVFYGRFVRNITKEVMDKYAEIMKVGEERLGNIKTVKMFCKEKYENQLFSEQLMDALNIGYRETKARATFYGMTGLSGNIIILSVLYYGGTMVSNSEMTVGALTSFILYAGYTAISIGGLSNFYTELNKAVGSATRLWEIVDRKHTIPVEGGLVLNETPRGEIVFDKVSFNYPSRPHATVLRGLSLKIEPGTSTAVVGRSGSGKSTLALLLLRLYDPQEGTISLDGRDLRDLNPTSLRQHIGAVNQEPVLFSGSIRENILYGLNLGDKISEREFERVIREAHVYEFAKDFPDGMNTRVGQRGIMLSGGQKQRVAIARAIIRNPKILILDEATSALDAVSEELIQNALENLTKNRTVLTIAHRLSTIRNATNIAVLQNGKVVEHGNYEQLIAKEDGMFKELVQRQTFASSV